MNEEQKKVNETIWVIILVCFNIILLLSAGLMGIKYGQHHNQYYDLGVVKKLCDTTAKSNALEMLDSLSNNTTFCVNETNKITGIVVSQNEFNQTVLFPKCFFVQKLEPQTKLANTTQNKYDTETTEDIINKLTSMT